ncbi:hypothetical protein ES705_22642 [subsurface metagenome]
MITKNYIKMCEKSEIQKWYFSSEDERLKNNWLFEFDVFACKEHRVIFRFHQKDICPAVKGNLCNRRNNKIWLPTQEQLQEMIHQTDWHGVLIAFRYWYQENVEYEVTYSMNELWLAFVMKEKYNKTWTGKDWVKYEKINNPN